MVYAILFRIFWACVAISIDKNDFFRLIFLVIFVAQVVRSSASPLCRILSHADYFDGFAFMCLYVCILERIYVESF